MSSRITRIPSAKKILKKQEHDEEETETADTELLAKMATSGVSDQDALQTNGIYYVAGEIKEGGLTELHQNILLKHFLGAKHWSGDIQFLINSPGGSLDETNALLDLLSNIRMDVRTVGLGQCASAAAMLLASGTPGKRCIGPSTMVMIHVYSWGTHGKHHELVASRKAQDATHEREVLFWMKHSKYKNAKDVEKHLLTKEDNYLTAKDCVRHGIVDMISAVIR